MACKRGSSDTTIFPGDVRVQPAADRSVQPFSYRSDSIEVCFTCGRAEFSIPTHELDDLRKTRGE